MTPQQQAIFAIIVLVLAIGLTIWANKMRDKAMKIAMEANIRCKRAKEESEELKKENDELKKKGVELQREIEIQKTCIVPYASQPLRFGMTKTNSFFDVIADYEAIDHNHVTRILIKRFEFGDDRDFALLEAQELLDHLNEK